MDLVSVNFSGGSGDPTVPTIGSEEGPGRRDPTILNRIYKLANAPFYLIGYGGVYLWCQFYPLSSLESPGSHVLYLST